MVLGKKLKSGDYVPGVKSGKPYNSQNKLFGISVLGNLETTK
jgi:hypothetical protein